MRGRKRHRKKRLKKIQRSFEINTAVPRLPIAAVITLFTKAVEFPRKGKKGYNRKHFKLEEHNE